MAAVRANVRVSARVVGPGVEVEEPCDQMVRVERRQVVQGLLLGDLVVPLADAPSPRQVVQPQRRGVGARQRLGHDAVAPEERDQEGQGRDQMRRVVEQPLALGEVLVDEADLALLEVAEPAVHHLGGLRRRTRGEVALFDKCGLQAPARCVERHARPGDAAADDEHVERLVRQAAQHVVAAKGVHGPSLPQPPRGRSGARRGTETGDSASAAEGAVASEAWSCSRRTTRGRRMRGLSS